MAKKHKCVRCGAEFTEYPIPSQHPQRPDTTQQHDPPDRAAPLLAGLDANSSSSDAQPSLPSQEPLCWRCRQWAKGSVEFPYQMLR